jgi:hypothetical protein
MPIIRAHQSSDGQLFKNYEDYVVHEEALKFKQGWDKAFSTSVEFDNEEQEALFVEFVQSNQDALVEVIQGSKVRRKGGKKK